MSASFDDFAEAVDNSAKYQRAKDAAETHSGAYWAAHHEWVRWNRRINNLVMSCTLTAEQIQTLKKKNVRAFNNWFD